MEADESVPIEAESCMRGSNMQSCATSPRHGLHSVLLGSGATGQY